jgi:transposase InsO family protein
MTSPSGSPRSCCTRAARPLTRILTAEGLNRSGPRSPAHPPPRARARAAPFQDGDLGVLHRDIEPLPRLETADGERRKRVLDLAIDRASRWGHLALRDDERAGRAMAVLNQAIAAAPVQVPHGLTDRGAGVPAQAVEATCRELKVQPRRTRPCTPQTTGRVERFKGRVEREGLGITVHSPADLETLLQGVTPACHKRRQRGLQGASPEQVIEQRLAARPLLANPRFNPPDPGALPQALHVVAAAREASHPDS